MTACVYHAFKLIIIDLRNRDAMLRRLTIVVSAVLLLCLAGCVISPRRDVVVSGGGGGATPTGKLYVTNDANNSIIRFDNAFTANGNVAPAATIAGTITQISKIG